MGMRSGLKIGEDEADAPGDVSGEEHLGDGEDNGVLTGKGDDLSTKLLWSLLELTILSPVWWLNGNNVEQSQTRQSSTDKNRSS